MFADGEEIAAGQVLEALAADPGQATAAHAGGPDGLPTSGLPTSVVDPCGECGRGGPGGPACCDPQSDAWPTLAECEWRLLRATLEKTSHNQSAAADLLGIERHLLLRKLRKYGLVPIPDHEAPAALKRWIIAMGRAMTAGGPRKVRTASRGAKARRPPR